MLAMRALEPAGSGLERSTDPAPASSRPLNAERRRSTARTTSAVVVGRVVAGVLWAGLVALTLLIAP